MPKATAVSPEQFTRFGPLLKYLRQRAGLTQRELSIAAGYTISHLSRLEHDQRPPDAAVLAARFVPALGLEDEPDWAARLLELAAASRGETEPPTLPAAPPKALAEASPEPPGFLPIPLTSFVGRERELAEIQQLLAPAAGARLVSLLGAGGSGKTRLALRAAEAARAGFPEGVWFVDLAPLADAQRLDQTLVAALGLVDDPQRTPLAVAISFLKSRTALVVLDNCEHLIGACAETTQALLQACPRLRLLATSREALGVAGEHVYTVPPLPAPDPANLPTFDELPKFEAVRLFVERARSAFAGFELTPANAQAVAQVCWQLDGIPLALELAAARVQTLRVEQIAERLAAYGRFRLLTSGSRTAPPRQQTLHSMIEWSHALLTRAERVLFRRLSVFAGGWTLEAAEAVARDGSETSEGGGQIDSDLRLLTSDVLDLLTQLAKKSLIIVERRPGAETRYRMLETIRQFAQERLWEAGEGAAVQQRHLAYFVALAERAAPELRGPDQVAWLDRVEVELDNVRAALAWSAEDELEAGLRLATALRWLWHCRGRLAEGRDWLERLLALAAQRSGAKPQLAYAEALVATGFLHHMLWNMDRVSALVDEAEPIARRLGAAGRPSLAEALRLKLVTAISNGDLTGARTFGEASLALSRTDGDHFNLAETLQHMESVAELEGDFALSKAYNDEGLVLRLALGDKDGQATTLIGSGDSAWAHGDYAGAIGLFADAVRLWRELRNPWAVSYGLTRLGLALWHQGELQEAIRCFEDHLVSDRRMHAQGYIALASCFMGELEFSQGRLDAALAQFAAALVNARDFGSSRFTLEALVGQAKVACALQENGRARRLYREASQAAVSGTVDHLHQARLVRGLAALAVAEGQPAKAARLLGAAGAVPLSRILVANPIPPVYAEHEQAVAAARAVLGEAAFAAAWAAGEAMSLEEAIEYALAADSA